MRDLIIVGASGFGREVNQIIKDVNKVEPTWNVLGFLDDNLNALDEYKCDRKIIGTIKDWIPNSNEHFVIAIAAPKVKEKIVSELQLKGAKFVSIIHPTALISDYTFLGEGIVIYPYAKVNVNSSLGDYVSLLGSIVAHDVKVGNYSTVCGTCSLNGHVEIGERVFVGSHVVIAPSKKIGDDAYIGNGSVVIRNVRARTKVFGNPAKRIEL